MKKQPIHLHTEHGLKRIGSYIKQDDGMRILRCPRKKSLHYFHKEDGWAVDKRIVDILSRKGLDFIVIQSEEEKKDYIVHVDVFKRDGIEINYGYGTQIVLNIRYWQIAEPPSIKL